MSSIIADHKGIAIMGYSPPELLSGGCKDGLGLGAVRE